MKNRTDYGKNKYAGRPVFSDYVPEIWNGTNRLLKKNTILLKLKHSIQIKS